MTNKSKFNQGGSQGDSEEDADIDAAFARSAAEIEDLHLPEENHGAAVIARIVATKT